MSSPRGRIYDCICPEACWSIREPLDSVGGSIYVPITCDRCKNTLVFRIFSRGFTRYRDATQTCVASLLTAVGRAASLTRMAAPVGQLCTQAGPPVILKHNAHR